MRLEIPFPPRILHPNARAHWSKRCGPSKRYKHDCFYLAKAGRWVPPAEGDIDLVIEWHPKDHNDPDIDGCIANLKAGLDGLAMAWGVNDKRFRPIIRLMPAVKGGKVTVTHGDA